jgi:hypothetical protein
MKRLGHSAGLIFGGFIGAGELAAGPMAAFETRFPTIVGPTGPSHNSVGPAASVFISSLAFMAGSYVVARMSRGQPVRDGMAVGLLKFALIAMAIGLGAAPVWYCLADGVLALPAAWVAVQLALRFGHSPMAVSR